MKFYLVYFVNLGHASNMANDLCLFQPMSTWSHSPSCMWFLNLQLVNAAMFL